MKGAVMLNKGKHLCYERGRPATLPHLQPGKPCKKAMRKRNKAAWGAKLRFGPQKPQNPLFDPVKAILPERKTAINRKIRCKTRRIIHEKRALRGILLKLLSCLPDSLTGTRMPATS